MQRSENSSKLCTLSWRGVKINLRDCLIASISKEKFGKEKNIILPRAFYLACPSGYESSSFLKCFIPLWLDAYNGKKNWRIWRISFVLKVFKTHLKKRIQKFNFLSPLRSSPIFAILVWKEYSIGFSWERE